MTITLYDCATAPSPRRTRILLAEKQIEHEVIQIDLASKEQLGDHFRAINPRCTVPALRTEEGTVLAENTAIALYLERLKAQPPLFGGDSLDEALVIEWNARVESEGLHAVADVLRNSSPRMKDRALTGPLDIEQIPELAARGRKRLLHFFQVLDDRLHDREFLAVDSFSFADITAFVVVDFARWVKMKPSPEQTDLLRWFSAVNGRPSTNA